MPSQDKSRKIQKYTVLETLGEGVFGQVYKCINPQTSEVVAVKVLKHDDDDDDDDDFDNEVQLLKRLNKVEPDKVNIIRFVDHFEWNNQKCMAFEMLDQTLWDLIMERGGEAFKLSEIRVITKQLLVAFEALKKIGVAHTDLKADNIMLVNHKDQPLKVKLIDFGCALDSSEIIIGDMFQPVAIRAPEVTLGLPLSEALDMWTLGCCIAEWFLGSDIFAASSPYSNLTSIFHLVGHPTHEMLNKGIYTDNYFVWKQESGRYRFKTRSEYERTTEQEAGDCDYPLKWFKNLEEAIRSESEGKMDPEIRDNMEFLSLLKSLLCVDPERRITPSEALKHPFITMEHISNSNTHYAHTARKLMHLVEDPVKRSNITNQDVPQATVAPPNRPGFTQDPDPCPVQAKQEYKFIPCNRSDHQIETDLPDTNTHPNVITNTDDTVPPRSNSRGGWSKICRFFRTLFTKKTRKKTQQPAPKPT